MIKTNNLARVMIMLLTISSLSCNGPSTTSATDSATAAPLDSMPVIKPNVPDTTGVMTTPSVNDHNNIIPDSAH